MIQTVQKNMAAYPRRLSQLSGMPKTLYYIGSLPDDDIPTAAIVGARLCTGYGHDAAYGLGSYLASRGVQIISGMAIGVDGYAHQGALDAGGRTFAVLASGVDVCYPKTNADLYDRMLMSGGVLSEQPPGTKPLPYFFPPRNRMISAFADIVIVVEAKRNSGSLITVDFALDQGRTVCAVPGRMGDSLSDGCNFLISQGAGIVLSKEALYEELMQSWSRRPAASPARQIAATERQSAPSPAEPAAALIPKSQPAAPGSELLPHCGAVSSQAQHRAAPAASLSPLARKLLDQFPSNDSLTPDDASRLLSLPVPSVSAALIELQIAGLLTEAARGHYRIRGAAPRSH